MTEAIEAINGPCHVGSGGWGWRGQDWLGVAKVSCWARPAILVAGKGRGGYVFISSVSLLSFLFLFLPFPSLSSPLLSLLSLFYLSLGDDTK